MTAVARLASAILRAAWSVRVLATSRRVLGISGEFAWPVPPLDLPPPDAASAAAISSHAAVALFIERATAVRPDLTVDDACAGDIAAICLALDGLPLAIELAAARTELLSPAAIRARLEDRFALLVDGVSDVAARQQTLRAAIDWSFELLSADQRTFFARLGTFAGSFDLDASLTVAGYGLDAPLEMLASLVKQSMVARAGQDRYRLLDTLRAYALEVLTDLDADETRDRHADAFVQLAEQGEVEVRGPHQLAVARTLPRRCQQLPHLDRLVPPDRRLDPCRPPGGRARLVLDPERNARRGGPAPRAPRRCRRPATADPGEVPLGIRPARRVARPAGDGPRPSDTGPPSSAAPAATPPTPPTA